VIQATVSEVVPLIDLEAYRLLEDRGNIGKVVVSIRRSIASTPANDQ